jgi:signal transduction histidine kinase
MRQALARELHDRVGQTLTTMLVELENFKADQAGRESVLRKVDVFEDSTRDVLNSLRAVLYELRGEVGVEDTLVMSLGSLVARFQEKTRIITNLTVHSGWPDVLKSSAALNVYRIIEEALANVRLHSGAGAVRIVLGVHSDTELAVTVTDDGRGVDTDQSRPLGLGMVGIRERALILGGQVRFESQDGNGTTVRATFPRIRLVAEELTA